MYGHICRSRSTATLTPESLTNEPLPKLCKSQSSLNIAQRYSDINSPTRYFNNLNLFKIKNSPRQVVAKKQTLLLAFN